MMTEFKYKGRKCTIVEETENSYVYKHVVNDNGKHKCITKKYWYMFYDAKRATLSSPHQYWWYNQLTYIERLRFRKGKKWIPDGEIEMLWQQSLKQPIGMIKMRS